MKTKIVLFQFINMLQRSRKLLADSLFSTCAFTFNHGMTKMASYVLMCPQEPTHSLAHGQKNVNSEIELLAFHIPVV